MVMKPSIIQTSELSCDSDLLRDGDTETRCLVTSVRVDTEGIGEVDRLELKFILERASRTS